MNRKRAYEYGYESDIMKRDTVRFLRESCATSAPGVMIHDAEGSTVYANRIALKMLGLSYQDVIGQKTLKTARRLISEDGSLLPPDELPSMKTLRTGKPVNNFVIGVLSRKGNKHLWMHASTEPVMDIASGTLKQVITTLVDITHCKRAGERLLKLYDTLLGLGPDPQKNINRLTALCGELLGAAFASYSRLDGGVFCHDIVQSGGGDVVVIPNLPESHYAQTDPNVSALNLQTYVGIAVKFSEVHVGSLCAAYQQHCIPSESDKGLMKAIAAAIGVEEGHARTIQDLKESQENYRTVAEFTYDWEYWMDSEGIFLYVSPSCERITGYPPEDFLDDPGLYERIIHPDDLPKVQTHTCEINETGEVKPLDFRIIRKDGEERWIGHVCQVVYDTYGNAIGIRGSNRDITERKQTEHSLQEAEMKYRSLVEESLVGVYILQQNRFLYVNPRLAEIFGYSQDEIIDKKGPMDLTAPEYRHLVAENLRKRFTGEVESIHYAFKGVRKDGQEIDVEVMGTVTSYCGNAAIIGSLLDVTERVQVERWERELEQHKREFYRRTIIAATDGKLEVTERTEIEEVAGSPFITWIIRRPEDISAIRQEAVKLVKYLGMDQSKIDEFALCVGEAATNALKHGGGGKASLHDKLDRVVFVVSDCGPGIEALILPEATLRKGYSTAGSLGMGYKAMIVLADKVYLATSPMGTMLAVEMAKNPADTSTTFTHLPDTWGVSM